MGNKNVARNSRNEEKDKELRKILAYLSQSQNILNDPKKRKDVYKRLEALYHIPGSTKGYRHYYNDILSSVIEIKESKDGAVEELVQNLKVLNSGYKPCTNKDVLGNPIDISDNLRKLFDHVNLDVTRIQYTDNLLQRNSKSEDIKNLFDNFSEADKNMKKIESSFRDVRKKLDNSQNEYIAILGIFSSVVLAFTGGMAFSSSVLNNINEAPAGKLLLITFVLGFILFSTIYSLLMFVCKMTDKKTTWKPLLCFDGLILILIIAVFVFKLPL